MSEPFTDGGNYVGQTGIEITEISIDRVLGRIVIGPRHQQPYGLIHGGVHCTLAETLASEGAAFWATEQGMAGAVGLSNKTDFIKGITEGVILGEATPIHRGRTHQIWQIFNTREEDGRLLAQSQVRLQNVTSTEF
jgi:1,4-dihydroxy-2-naphthoyl-CoA hydrolase